MQLQLLITASAATLSRILAICAEDGATASVPNAPTTFTPPSGAGSIPASTATTPIAPAQTDADDESSDTAPTGTVDKDGLPHDTRIHSDPAKLTAKGLWRKRRNVDDATVAAVEAELRANAPTPASAPVTPPPPVAAPAPVAAPVTPPPPPVAAPAPIPPAMPPLPAPADVSQVPPVTVPIPAAPAPQPAPPPPPVAGPLDYTGFMTHVSQQFGVPGPDGAPKIDTDYLLQRVNEINTAWAGQPGFTPLTVITDIANGPRAAELVAYAKSLLIRDEKW